MAQSLPEYDEDQDPWSEAELVKLTWYHGFIPRHLSESLLRGVPEGAYLLRRRCPTKEHEPVTFALSFRSRGTPEHLKLVPNGNGYQLTPEQSFSSVEAFAEYMKQGPFVSTNEGIQVQLNSPYPREPDQTPHGYKQIESIVASPNAKQIIEEQNLILASKEGFLQKDGKLYKKPRRRWFVLDGMNLSYYKTDRSQKYIKCIDLGTATELVTLEDPDDASGLFGLQLITPTRVWCFHAETAEHRDSWRNAIAMRINPSLGLR